MVEEEWAELIRPSLGVRRTLLILLVLGVIIPTIVVMVGVRRITGPLRPSSRPLSVSPMEISRSPYPCPPAMSSKGWLTSSTPWQPSSRSPTNCWRHAWRSAPRNLSALNAVAGVVSRSLDLERILPDALEETIEVMGMQGGAIFRLDEEAQSLVQVTYRNLESGDGGAGREPAAQFQHHPPGAGDAPPGLPAWCEITRRAPVRQALEKDGWQTVVSIPLVAQEKVLGAINVISQEIVPPSEEALAVPAAIGQQIGVAIDNARLYAQSVEYARQMELARQAADAANTSKSVFLANVSHELRTPLVSILGFARIVQKRLDERLFPYLSKPTPGQIKPCNRSTKTWRSSYLKASA